MCGNIKRMAEGIPGNFRVIRSWTNSWFQRDLYIKNSLKLSWNNIDNGSFTCKQIVSTVPTKGNENSKMSKSYLKNGVLVTYCKLCNFHVTNVTIRK